MRAFFKRQPVRDLLILFAAVMLLTLPFLNKAFDWDDREFIEFAQVLAEDPSQLHLEDLSYKGNYYEEFRTTHPPLLSYYLSAFLRLGADVGEPLFRGAYLVFPLIAAASMYALARRFTRHALVASLLLLFTTGFIVISHTLMGDMPGLSMWLASIALYIWGVDRGSWRLLLAAGVVMALAVLVAYQALSLIPLLLFYALIKRRFRVRAFVPFVFPLLAFGAYAGHIYYHYGGLPVLSYGVGIRYGWQDLELKLRAMLVFIGGATIFPLSVIVLYLRKKVDLLVAFLLLPPLLTWSAIYYLSEGDLDSWQALVLAVMFTAGFLALYKLCANTIVGLIAWTRGRRGWTDPLFLLAWASGVLLYVGIFLPFVTVRFLLPLFPPLVLVFVREAEALWPMRPRLRAVFVTATLALTLLLGFSVAVADYRLAGIQRTMAQRFGQEYGNSDRKVWFLGEFGFRYYMQQQGFEYLGVRSHADRGDLVIESHINAADVVAPLPPGSYRVLAVERPEDRFPLRVMSPWAGAGFYAHLMGPLPEMFSRTPLDEFTVYELDWQEEGGEAVVGN